jgi:radical SAM protein with 4Fe4S-binding SPASM domain
MQDWETLNAEREEIRRAVLERRPFRPLYVKIKLTWRCNLRCTVCNVWRQSRENRLTLPVVSGLAEELAELGTEKVHLSGGEALLYPPLMEAIPLFAEKRMRVNLTTNGTLLTPETAARLVESGIRNVSISLDGATPAVHDAIRGKGNWKRTLRGIRNLRRAAKHARRKPHIRINTVITRSNYRDVVGLPEIAYQAGADRLTLIPVDDPGGRVRLNKRRIREFNEEVAPFLADRALAYGMIEVVGQAYPFGREKPDLESSKAGLYARGLYGLQSCYMPWVHAMIDPKGHVYPCCTMRSGRPLGNLIKEGSFRNVWEGTAFRRFRGTQAEGRPPASCHTCDDFLEENRLLHHLAREVELDATD